MSATLKRPGAEISAKTHVLTLSPVAIWATVGAILLAINAYAVLSWINAPSFTPAPLGDAIIPSGELFFLRVFETISTIAAILFAWFYLIRPWRRTGSISWDGMLVIAFFLMWVWDPLTNAINATWWYNGYLYNMQSWANFIPGWSSPNHEHFVEPIFLMGPCYIWFFAGPMMFGCAVLKHMLRKYPTLGFAGGLATLFVAVAVFDAVVEIYFVRTGAGAYPGVVQSLSIWGGTPYQWPLYEGPIMGWTLSAFACLRYFRDDKGLSFCEKGVDKLALSTRAKTFVRFLALVGVTHSIYLVLYFVPWNIFALHIDTHTPMPSYMRHGVCGKGTPYACPSPSVPIATKGSIPIGPEDPRLPADVRASQDGPSFSMFADKAR